MPEALADGAVSVTAMSRGVNLGHSGCHSAEWHRQVLAAAGKTSIRCPAKLDDMTAVRHIDDVPCALGFEGMTAQRASQGRVRSERQIVTMPATAIARKLMNLIVRPDENDIPCYLRLECIAARGYIASGKRRPCCSC